MPRPWEQPYAARFAGRKPRIAIGFVAYGDIDAGVHESCMHWAIQQGARYANVFELYLNVATRREQYRARNALVLEARKVGADFMLMLDDDHTIGDAPDMIRDFFAEEKPFQGGLYVQRKRGEIQPVIQKYVPAHDLCRWITPDELPAESGPVDVLGGGVNWIDCTVFDFMAMPHWWPFPDDNREIVFLPHPRFGLDMQFCLRIKRELGIDPWLNLKVQVGHAIYEREIVRPAAISGAMRCETCDGISYWVDSKWECATCLRRAA